MKRMLPLLLVASLLSAPVAAQSLRDPTQPPGSGVVTSGGASRASQGGWSVIVVDGRPHVAVGTRLYAEGQMLGRARVERISETEVWLREGKVLRKVPLYAGVLRRSVPAPQP